MNFFKAGGGAPDVDRLMRGKRSIALNLKSADGVNIIKKLCKISDVLIEPYRPGSFFCQKVRKAGPLSIFTQVVLFRYYGKIRIRTKGFNERKPEINLRKINGVRPNRPVQKSSRPRHKLLIR